MAEPRVASLLHQLVRLHLHKFAKTAEGPQAQEDALRYAQRILGSKQAAFGAVDSLTLVQQLQRQLAKTGQRQLALRVSDACQELSAAGVDECAVTALLSGLFDSGSQAAQSFTLAQDGPAPLLQQEHPFSAHFDARMDRSLRPPPAGLPRDGGPLPAARRAAADPHQESTSTLLVREVLAACQGLAGGHITVPEGDDAVTRIDARLGIPLPERQLMARLAELGWLFRKLRDHADRTHEGPAAGAVRQAFLCSLRQELADFYRLLAVLEGQAGNPLPDASGAAAAGGPQPPYLTLRRLLVWLGEPLVRMRWLAAVADSVAGLTGGRLLAALEASAAHGEPLVREALQRCLKLAAVPYLAQIWLWVFHGRLQPPPGDAPDFLIAATREGQAAGAPGHGKLWREGYRLNDAMRSPFVSPQLAQRILRAGKSLNFLRDCCGDVEWTQQASRTQLASEASGLQYDQKEALESVVTRAGSDIDAHVVHILLTKFSLREHCGAIKRYLLLGQGDFIEALMDNVGSELSRPAREISEFSLNGCLDASLRASSAQYDAPDQVNRLRIKLETSQLNDEGWDVFTLKYEVEEPLATVLDARAMKAYLRLFKLLWALKRAEHSLNDCWVELNSVQRQLTALPKHVERAGAQAYGTEKVWEELRQCHRLRNEMAHLVGSLQAYIMFEVVEAAWTGFLARLQSVKDLDGLIQAHEEYLATLLQRTLLDEGGPPAAADGPGSGFAAPQPDVQEDLRALLSQALELRPKIRLLADTVSSACLKARMLVQSAAASSARGGWGRQSAAGPPLGVEPGELARVHRQLAALDRRYGEQLAKFVGLLPSAAHVDLRFLLFRLEAGGQGRVTEDGSVRHSQP